MPNKPPVFRPAQILSPEQRRRAYDRERGSARARLRLEMGKGTRGLPR
jgi:hypothetical protein